MLRVFEQRKKYKMLKRWFHSTRISMFLCMHSTAKMLTALERYNFIVLCNYFNWKCSKRIPNWNEHDSR